MELEKVVLSSSPHVRDKVTVPLLMRDVIVALIPAAFAGALFFGPRAVGLMAISVIGAVLSEALYEKACHRPVTVGDWSAAVTGLLLAFNIPVTAPWWLPLIGSAFAMIIAKQFFGGLGQNFINPALAARAMLMAAWPARMTAWVTPFDAVSTATPLAILVPKAGESAASLPSYWNMFLGNIPGCIGETSALALLVGGVYLLLRGVIDWRIPVGFIGTVAFLTWAIGPHGAFTGDPLAHILTGGLMLGAFFMATDYVTSPVTRKGRLIMGIGCGIITTLIRIFGSYPEGVSYSILIMNIATPLIDKFVQPKVFGASRAR